MPDRHSAARRESGAAGLTAHVAPVPEKENGLVLYQPILFFGYPMYLGRRFTSSVRSGCAGY